MNIRRRAILAGGAALALAVGIGAGVMAVSPVNKAVAHAPGLTAQADVLPAAEASMPTPAVTPPAAPASMPVAAYAEPAEAERAQPPQYAQQVARDDPAAIAWPDTKAAPAPVDESQGPEVDGVRDVFYPPPPPPDASPAESGSPADGPNG